MAQQQNLNHRARAGIGFSIIKNGIGFFAGLFCIFLGLRSDPHDSMGQAGSAAQRYLGPHGNGIGCAIVGLLIALFCAWRVSRAFQQLKVVKAAEASQGSAL